MGGSVFNESDTVQQGAGSNFTFPVCGIPYPHHCPAALPLIYRSAREKLWHGIWKTTLAPLTLVRGNAAWTNNTIDSGDVSVVGTYWGQTPADLEPGDSLDGDVNFDGVVDLRDLAIVAGNFGLTSAQVYAGWTP